MRRETRTWWLLGALLALPQGTALALTRELAELEPTELAFGQSVLNQLTHETYRDPFDELQTRPYNLLFANIGRHSTLGPWQGQERRYTRYLNALIGNNGAANVDNDADAIQGALIRRETPALAWGVSGAFLSGTAGSDDTAGGSSFDDGDDLTGYELRVAAARQLGERRVLGAGLRATSATLERLEHSFAEGVGGFEGTDRFEQSGLALDVGLRQFQTSRSSWEARVVVGLGSFDQDERSDSLDGAGAVTERFVSRDYEVSDLTLGLEGGYHRLKGRGPGETAFRAGVERTERELDNSDLAYQDTGGTVTPSVTLLGQDALTANRVWLSAQSIFQAGETEMFTGARLDHASRSGATRIDASGTIVNEEVDDTLLRLGLTVGLRQPLWRDRLRFVISGHAELLDEETATLFDTGTDRDDASRSTALYAIGLEGVLANVVFDVAWLKGEEAPVLPVALGLPQGSRRTVELDQLVFSAGVSW